MQRTQVPSSDEQLARDAQNAVLNSVYAKYGLPPTSVDTVTSSASASVNIGYLQRYGARRDGDSSSNNHRNTNYFHVNHPTDQSDSVGISFQSVASVSGSRNATSQHTIPPDSNAEFSILALQQQLDKLRLSNIEKDERIEVLFAEITELRHQRETALKEQKATAQSRLDVHSENRMLKAETVRENNNADLRLQELESEKRCLQEEFSSRDARCKHLGNLLDQVVGKNQELAGDLDVATKRQIHTKNELAVVTSRFESLTQNHDSVLQAYSTAKLALQAYDPHGMHQYLPTFDGESTPVEPAPGAPRTGDHAETLNPNGLPGSLLVSHDIPRSRVIPSSLSLHSTNLLNYADVPVSPAGSMGTILPQQEQGNSAVHNL